MLFIINEEKIQNLLVMSQKLSVDCVKHIGIAEEQPRVKLTAI